ncbi:MAG: LysR family transcriptional regulator [Clostridiales bacterium]|nr:LysR family transcriptional regulator [Clostridiales bacterium]
MDIDFLREFMELSETCSYQDASERLYITNSTLSKHIQKMEAELGVPLFERSTRKVTLTEVGKILKEKCEKILPLYDEALMQMNMEATEATNTLTIAFTSPMYWYGVLDTILAFKDAHPQINLRLSELSDPPQKSAFTDNQAEFIFANSINGASKDIGYHPFRRDELLLITSMNSPLSQKSSIALHELAEEPLLLPNRAYLQDLFFNECAKEGFTPRVKLYAQDAPTALRLVESGYASAVFPRACCGEDAHIHMVGLSPVISFETYMLYMKNKPFSSVGKLFYDYVVSKSESNTI